MDNTIVKIFDIPFESISYAEAVHKIQRMLLDTGAHQVVLANAHTLNLAYADAQYRQNLQRAAMVLRDGAGVKLASLIGGRHLRYNFVGTDFIPRLLDDLGPQEVGIFLFGAKPCVVEAAGRELNGRYPHIRVIGYQHGYLPGEEWDDLVVQRINAVKPHIVLVALGNPLQEEWISRNLSQLEVKIAIGVGALFDYLTGKVPRAPRWMRRIGFEWLYRLFVEPRRLWQRYLIGNFQFIYRLILYHLRGGDH